MTAPAFSNPFAERAVLAALMRGDADADAIRQLNITDDLFTGLRREAFQELSGFYLDEKAVDAVVLKDALSEAALIEIETAWNEHVSAVNLPHWVAILKARRRDREKQAARDRLSHAVASGATPGELAAILDAIRDADAGERAVRLRNCDMTKLVTAELPPPDFVICPLLPRDQITLFGGHGGSGKTLIGLTLCAHVAAGSDWAGLPVQSGKVLTVSFEDQEDLILWRLRNIADEYGLNTDALIANIKLIDATAAQTIMQETTAFGIRDIRTTQDGEELLGMIAAEKFDLVLIDNASDAFDGDENSRRQVRKFVKRMADAIRVHHGALLLLAHIDKAAARYGTAGNSYSGSTAWHNSVRSRLALIDSELRQEKLTVSKPMESKIKLRFTTRGVPVPDDGGADSEERDRQERADDAAILACFAAAEAIGATVPTGERGPQTTWHALSPYEEFPTVLRKDKDRFRRGITRLLRAGAIEKKGYRDHRRHEVESYVLATSRQGTL